MPELSIITVNLNNLEGLRKTFNSVSKQCFTDYEYLIVDGKSEDGSKDFLTQNNSQIKWWISEPDTGVYNAMNKGIKKAKGEYLFFLNSGDCFYSEETLRNVFKQKPTTDIIYGSVKNIGPDREWIVTPPQKLSFGYVMKYNLPHQSTFYKRELFEKIGLYREDRKITSDWEFLLRALVFHQATSKYVDEIISVYPFDGISSRPENRELLMQERNEMLQDLFPYFLDDYAQMDECSKALNNYNRSRFHQLVERMINSKLYKFIKGK